MRRNKCQNVEWKDDSMTINQMWNQLICCKTSAKSELNLAEVHGLVVRRHHKRRRRKHVAPSNMTFGEVRQKEIQTSRPRSIDEPDAIKRTLVVTFEDLSNSTSNLSWIWTRPGAAPSHPSGGGAEPCAARAKRWRVPEPRCKNIYRS